MTVVVENDGGGLQAIGHDPGEGFGVSIMQQLADWFTVEDTGRGVLVRMRFEL